jgi:D-alanine-D-alanine ligase
MSKKIRVAVLYGGRSGEHDVSLESGAAIVANLDQEKFTVIPVSIDKKGHWLLNDLSVLDDSSKRLLLGNSHSTEALPHVEPQQEKPFDVVFPILHGTLGEDGAMQGFLELADMPYVGCGILSSAVCMDKDVSKRLVQQMGIPTPQFMTLYRYRFDNKQLPELVKEIEQGFGFPVFVKPANTGSSVGVNKVHNADELLPAMEAAFQIDQKILIEEGLNVREIELAALESLDQDQETLVSVAGEIIPVSDEFYSYNAKYLDADGAKAVIPAQLTAEQQATFKDYTRRIFEGLGCSCFARIDFFLEKETGKVIFNEVNTLPGFTTISMYPKLWIASGMTYQQLLTHLIELAQKHHRQKHALKYLK